MVKVNHHVGSWPGQIQRTVEGFLVTARLVDALTRARSLAARRQALESSFAQFAARRQALKNPFPQLAARRQPRAR